MCKYKEEKDVLRKKYIRIRNKIKDKDSKSNVIFSQLISLEEYKKSKIIAIYRSLKTEVDTTNLIDFSLKKNKIVVLPKVVYNDLKFYKISSLSEKLEKSRFGIEEPIENEKNFIKANEIDLIIIPGICFDIYKNRLGFGKGYYDRLLQGFKIKNIAICFEEQILINNVLPVTNNDIKVNKIVTDKKIYI